MKRRQGLCLPIVDRHHHHKHNYRSILFDEYNPMMNCLMLSVNLYLRPNYVANGFVLIDQVAEKVLSYIRYWDDVHWKESNEKYRWAVDVADNEQWILWDKFAGRFHRDEAADSMVCLEVFGRNLLVKRRRDRV